jgi:DNA-binding CsgD family transcriptional regulator
MTQEPSHTEAALVERAAELHVLEHAVAGLDRGTGGVVVLEATAGLGKTALLDHAAGVARDAGYLVRHAAPGPHERRFAFGVVRTLLEPPLRNLPASERAAILTGATAPAGALLLDAEIPEAADATAIAHGVMWACAGLARRQPLVLIIDDAQWCDRCSLQVLSYLAGRTCDLPLLILLAARPGDARAANDLLALLGGSRSGIALHLRPLTSMGTTRLIRRLAPQASIRLCSDWHRATGGDPWLLGELARSIQGHGQLAIETRVTDSARAVVRRRLAELEPRDRAVAAARAVIGAGAASYAVARVAAADLSELARADDALTSVGLIRPDRDGIAHELIASAIRDDLAPAEHERLHRQSAEALIELGATSEVIAHHLLQCRPHGNAEAGDWLERAGEDAVERGAPATAVTYLERALEERAGVASRGRLLGKLAAAAFDAGAPAPRTRLRGALEETPDRADRLHLLTRLAAHDVIFGGDAGDVQLLTDELADPRTGPEDRVRVQTALLDALVALPERHVERARRAAAIELNGTGDPVLRRTVIAHRAWLATELGTADAQTCAAMALDALDGGFLLRAARHRAAYHLCVAVLVATDHARHAHRAIVALRAEALARGSMPLQAAAATYAAELSLRTGRAGEAETEARDALELAGADASVFAERAARVLVAARAERGAFDEARQFLSACGRGELHAHAKLALAEGDFEQAHAHARDAGARDEQRGRPNPACAGWRSIASLALAHLGRRDQAVLLADGELALAESFGAPVPIARAMVARAVAEPDDRTRSSICRRALASLEASRACAELESVRLRLELGRTLARIGRRIEARELLRPALADADAVGASQLAERARRELVATGLRPRRAALEGASALTPRQRQIVELAAAGKGNRAIAEQLFLSIKTVETHLAAGYRKLGVSTRLDLSAAVAGRTR